MHEKVQAYLNTQNSAKQKEYEEEKGRFLIELGLFEKEYSPDNCCSSEYPFIEWNEKTDTERYYKLVPIAVTEEEYEALKKCSPQMQMQEGEQNPVARTLMVIAWVIFAGGGIAGLAFATENVGIAFACWCAAFISGMMFLGFAEIIKLLYEIKLK